MRQNDNKDTVGATFRVRPDNLQKLRDKVHELKKLPVKPKWSLDRVVDGLIEDWLGGKRVIQPTESTKADSRYPAEMKRLERILSSGTARQKSTIRNLLEDFAEAPETETAKPKETPPNPIRSNKTARDRQHPGR